MRKVVVDTSVAVKWFVPEVHTEAATRLLATEFVLFAPDLIGPELANTLWKKVRRGELTQGEAEEILAAFENLPIEVTPSRVLLAAALQVAIALDRSVYDCLYLALAVAQDCALLTADRRFHSAVLASSALAPYIRWVEDQL
jgi:predicted nucleic acid-binding protein